METIKINIIRDDALSILKVMEKAGLITMQKKELKIKNLAQQLRGTISSSRANEMIQHVNLERKEWDERY